MVLGQRPVHRWALSLASGFRFLDLRFELGKGIKAVVIGTYLGGPGSNS